jgi:hypothetical protein
MAANHRAVERTSHRTEPTTTAIFAENAALQARAVSRLLISSFSIRL